MKDINLHSIKAVFFDRGNVTHDCCAGLTENEREIEASTVLSTYIQKVWRKAIDPKIIHEEMIQKWKADFPLRGVNGREMKLELYLAPFLHSIGVQANDVEMEEIIVMFGSTYITGDVPNTGIASLMATIKGMGRKVGIISNTILPDSVYKQMYIEDGLDEHIDSYTFSYNSGYRKPNKAILDIGCKAIGVEINESIIVGDKLKVDIACAKNAGVKGIWYNPHNETNADGIEPDYIIKSFKEMEERIAI
jgi:FMN phosphatase YigB (HAD superfamily)